MQRFKAALLQRRNNLHIHSLRFLNQFHTRNLCSLPDTNITDELENQVSFNFQEYPFVYSLSLTTTHYLSFSLCLSLQVLVEGKAWSRTAILNRPSVLNCLSTAMVCFLLDTLWVCLCFWLLGSYPVCKIGSVGRFVFWVFVFMVFGWESLCVIGFTPIV